MKILFRTIHLYLALTAGLVILLSCLTGAIMVFENELDHMANRYRYYVKAEKERVPLEQLIKKAERHVPNTKWVAVKVFTDPLKSVEVALMVADKNEQKVKETSTEGKHKAAERKNMGAKSRAKPSVFVYLNPYNGRVLDVYNKQESFFFTVEMLHRFLLGGKNSIGRTIIGLSTLSFLIITLTGIVLWWPKNKKILIQRLKFKINGSFKRLNHDLHIVSGFYSSIFLTVIIVTGLVMAFPWLSECIFSITGSKMENPESPSSPYLVGQVKVLPEDALNNVNLGRAEYYAIRNPKDSIGTYSVTVLPEGLSANRSETYFVDQYTSQVLGVSKFADKNVGQKIRSYIKPVHTGEVFGMTTKILNFILAVLAFCFPITGVIMWLNRIKATKKRTKPI